MANEGKVRQGKANETNENEDMIRGDQLLSTENTEGLSLENDDELEEVAVGEGIKLPLRAEAYVSNGKTYHAYFVPVIALGREMKIELRPTNTTKFDNEMNAHFILNAIFDQIEGLTGRREYVLNCQKRARKDDFGKRTISMVYEVVYKDPNDGKVYSVGMKPYGDSNRRLLESQYNAKATF